VSDKVLHTPRSAAALREILNVTDGHEAMKRQIPDIANIIFKATNTSDVAVPKFDEVAQKALIEARKNAATNDGQIIT